MSVRLDILVRLALAALILASCDPKPLEPDDDPWKPLSGSRAIGFNADLFSSSTRTDPLPSGYFGVFAFYQPGTIGGEAGDWGDGSGWIPNFMFNQKVAFDGSFTYTPLRYWPSNEENTITFWAYAPYEDESTVVKHIDRMYVDNSPATYDNESPGIPEIKYTTDGFTDFLVSDIEENQRYYGENPVNPDATVHFTFRHAMCKVDFKVKKSDPDNLFTVSLTSLSLNDIYFTGVYNQYTRWNAQMGATDDLNIYSGSATLDNTTPLVISTVGGKLIMPLPQQLKNKAANLHVEYTLQRGSASPVSYQSDFLLEDVMDAWVMNAHYTYNINIFPGSPILFTASVEQWESEESGYFNVN